MENHYKDNYWLYPEFAQKRDVFLGIVGQIDSPWFGVNFDPSNAIVAGEDPLVLLEAVKERVVTMHASDRYLESGTLDDLKTQDGSLGYARNLKHGVIGKGLNDYDRIFSILKCRVRRLDLDRGWSERHGRAAPVSELPAGKDQGALRLIALEKMVRLLRGWIDDTASSPS